jgi:hypothetical protein
LQCLNNKGVANNDYTPEVAMPGPITRVQLSSFLSTAFCAYDNILLPNDIFILSNYVEVK